MLRFVINLDRATDRMDHMRSAIASLGIDVERVSAVDGKKLSPENLKALQTPIHDISKIICPRTLTSGEVGAFLSHQECWRRLVNSDQQWALILEDDLAFSPRAKTYFATTEWIPSGIDLVQFFLFRKNWTAKVDKKIINLVNGDSLSHPYKPSPVGAQAYVISRNAAENALKLSRTIMAPVDEFLFNPVSDFARMFPVYRLNPAVVIPLDDELPSTIGVKKEEVLMSSKMKYHPQLRLRRLQLRLKVLFNSKIMQFVFK